MEHRFEPLLICSTIPRSFFSSRLPSNRAPRALLEPLSPPGLPIVARDEAQELDQMSEDDGLPSAQSIDPEFPLPSSGFGNAVTITDVILSSVADGDPDEAMQDLESEREINVAEDVTRVLHDRLDFEEEGEDAGTPVQDASTHTASLQFPPVSPPVTETPDDLSEPLLPMRKVALQLDPTMLQSRTKHEFLGSEIGPVDRSPCHTVLHPHDTFAQHRTKSTSHNHSLTPSKTT
ncbi:hypothetical protein HBH98_080920 [Parastagonospora nodorum]|nr:hypothetical protein HBI10_087220 [Parastagonospora nodorum]KAH4027241.1 hypothetical protein HBI13_056240 [Parastagonospora nodorum]KAH4223434.1 hypothetical protein HBI06_134980 [Parastagonospora nodorum]KAH4231092.1 hypothetical protein HBI05_185150 [Parastagonospora nodorum]KAH4261581.1 hypothetical protein HBI03_113470 [Parastagonospora nodorum]